MFSAKLGDLFRPLEELQSTLDLEEKLVLRPVTCARYCLV